MTVVHVILQLILWEELYKSIKIVNNFNVLRFSIFVKEQTITLSSLNENYHLLFKHIFSPKQQRLVSSCASYLLLLLHIQDPLAYTKLL